MSITTATRQTVQFSAKVCPVEYELYGRYAHKRLSSPLSPPPPALWQHPPSCVACTPPGPFSGHSPPPRGLPVSYCPSQLYPLGPLLSQAHLLKELMSCQVFSKEAVWARAFALTMRGKCLHPLKPLSQEADWVEPVKELFAFKETEILPHNLVGASALTSWKLFLRVPVITPTLPKLYLLFGVIVVDPKGP